MQLKCSQTQKCSKDIAEIVYVAVVQTEFYEVSRILSVCKENKNNNFIQQFFSTCMHRGTLDNGRGRWRGREELLNKVAIFVFFAHKTVFS